jgi:hypothetical protein
MRTFASALPPSVASLVLSCALLICFPALAADFPSGRLVGIGFKIERGSMLITNKDLYVWDAYAVFENLSDSRVRITINSKMQKAKHTPLKNDKRVDTFEIEWDSENTGKLFNEALAYKGDKSTFKIEDGKLTIKSWIARNKLSETHIYELAK